PFPPRFLRCLCSSALENLVLSFSVAPGFRGGYFFAAEFPLPFTYGNPRHFFISSSSSSAASVPLRWRTWCCLSPCLRVSVVDVSSRLICLSASSPFLRVKTDVGRRHFIIARQQREHRRTIDRYLVRDEAITGHSIAWL